MNVAQQKTDALIRKNVPFDLIDPDPTTKNSPELTPEGLSTIP